MHWFFVVSVLLFVSGIAFLVAGARQRSPAAAEAAELTTVASTRQLMNSIIVPAAGVVYRAVGTTVSAAGSETVVPANDREWAAVADGAAALVESGNLLLMGPRAVDRGDWEAATRAMMDAGRAILKAAEAKDPDGVFSAGSDITAACDRCHGKYRRD